MNKLLGLLMISCFLLNEVEPKLNSQLTDEEVKAMKLMNLLASLDENMTILNPTNNLQLDADSSITISSSMKVYNEEYCISKQSPITPFYLQGAVEDNKVTFEEEVGTEYTVAISISPDINQQGFNIDFGSTAFSNGFELHISDNSLKCKTSEGFLVLPNMKGELCVQSYNMKRGSGGTVKGCFIVGGAVLSSKHYDINTINTFNTLSAAVIDFGCYSATNTEITQNSNNDSDARLTSALGAIVAPIHTRLCNSASQNLPFLLPVFILTLKSIFSY